MSKIAHSEPAVVTLPIRNRVGGDDRSWHFASIRTHALNGRYWSNSEHLSALVWNASVAIDPKRTFKIAPAPFIQQQTSRPNTSTICAHLLLSNDERDQEAVISFAADGLDRSGRHARLSSK